MEYRYCENRNWEDFSSGRVLYGTGGVPNFPVRLANEMYRRALACVQADGGRQQEEGIVLYDCCCGGGYSLTVLGLMNQGSIRRIYASDIDRDMLSIARINLSLLTREGMERRRKELERFLVEYQKPSHKEALQSLDRLEQLLEKEIPCTIFAWDAMEEADTKGRECRVSPPGFRPDIILTDVPYGNLVEWEGGKGGGMERMLSSLSHRFGSGVVLAVCMDKKQKPNLEKMEILDKEMIGKRKFVIGRLR